MDAIAKAVSGKTESYMGDRTCGELVEEFYPLIVDDILQNRQVNRDTLRPWLEDLKKIADNCGILPSRKEGRAANIWDLGSDVKLVLQETDGFNQAMTPYAVAELLNANVVSVENAFIRRWSLESTAGVNTWRSQRISCGLLCPKNCREWIPMRDSLSMQKRWRRRLQQTAAWRKLYHL